MLGNSPVIDLIGIFVGHIYYFLEDVLPTIPAGRGQKVLVTPRLLQMLLDAPAPFADPVRVTHVGPEGLDQ